MIPQLLDLQKNERIILVTPSFHTYQDAPNTLQNTGLQANLSAILDAVRQQYPVREKGVVFYGFSRGGMFATEFIVNYPAGIYGIVAEGAPGLSHPRQPIPIVMIYGTADETRFMTQADRSRLLANGYPLEIISVPDSGHHLTTIGLDSLVKMIRGAYEQAP